MPRDLHGLALFPRFRTASLLVVFAVAGCHTSDDSKLAATQLSAASKALTAYYTALDSEMQAGAGAAALDQVLLPAEKDKYAKWQGEFERDHDEIQLRLKLAQALSRLADAFTALSGSKSAADAKAASATLQTAIADLHGTTFNAASGVPIPDLVQSLTTAFLEHKERQVAGLMSKVMDETARDVDADKAGFRLAHAKYLKATSEGSTALVASGEANVTDLSAGMAKDVVAPYGLSAKLKDDTVAKVKQMAPHLIEEQSARAQQRYDDAEDAMHTALVTLAATLKDLGSGKTFSSHLPPLALDDVNSWAANHK